MLGCARDSLKMVTLPLWILSFLGRVRNAVGGR
nr:MAG TPA: hypothetical protein [Caudoviricetes sp.]